MKNEQIELVGTQKKFKITSKNIEVKLGTIDKQTQSSMFMEFGLWVTPIVDDMISSCRRLDIAIRHVLRSLVIDNLGYGHTVLFNLEYASCPEYKNKGTQSYIRFETTILFADGCGWDPYDERFKEMAEDLITWVESREDIECQKFRATRKQKGVI